VEGGRAPTDTCHYHYQYNFCLRSSVTSGAVTFRIFGAGFCKAADNCQTNDVKTMTGLALFQPYSKNDM